MLNFSLFCFRMAPKRKPDDDPGPSRKKPRFLYPPEAMAQALQAVREGMKTTRQAARDFNVPFSTLQAKVKGKHPEGRRMGPKTVLTDEEEDILVRYIVAKAKKGFPLHKRNLVDTVQKIVTEDQRQTPFTNNKPGNSWVAGFFKRHNEITQRHSEVINRGRAKVTEEKIRGWGNGLREYLKEEKALDILDDPTRIFNADESGFRTNPDTGLVLGPINYEHFYIVKDGSEKENISALFTASAAGEIVPPCIVFPYVRIPREIAMNCNPEWSVGRSPSGWMTGQVFFGYIGNTFIPWLKSRNVKFPVLLLIDGHRSHLTLNVCRLCEANGIILYALLPNATHIIQPLDVSVFRSLKAGWKVFVEDWKNQSKNRVLTRAKFPSLFEKVIDERATPKIIQNGFRKCGIFPFDLNAIDYTKCMNHASRSSETNDGARNNFVSAKPCNFGVEHLLYVESCMEGTRPEEFREKEKTAWDGDVQAVELFNLWKKLRNKIFFEDSTRDPKNRTEADPSESTSSLLSVEKEAVVPGLETSQAGPSTSTSSLLSVEKEAEVGPVTDLETSEAGTSTPLLTGTSVEKEVEILPSSETSVAVVTENETTVKTPVKIPLCKKNISPAFLGNVIWPTESPNKSKKNTNNDLPKERLPHAASSKRWIDYWEKQDEKKEQKQRMREEKAKERREKKEKKGETTKKKIGKRKDWTCPRCKGSYNDDVEMCNGRIWIGPCSECNAWYHKNCVSKKILSEFGLKDSCNDEETDFVCDTCFGDTDDEMGADFLQTTVEGHESESE